MRVLVQFAIAPLLVVWSVGAVDAQITSNPIPEPILKRGVTHFCLPYLISHQAWNNKYLSNTALFFNVQPAWASYQLVGLGKSGRENR
jgi:hypothetical protein